MKKIIILAIVLVFVMAWNVWASSTVNFYIQASADDGDINWNGAGYPPTGGGSGVVTSGTIITAKKTYTGYDFGLNCFFLRFDTSSIPDNATIDSAYLHLKGYSTSGGTRYLDGEYFSWTTLDASYNTATVGTTAFSKQLSGMNSTGTNSILLSSPNDYIQKNAYTGFRIGISGGEPSGENYFNFSSRDSGTANSPILVVTYTTPVPPSAPGNPTFSNVANKAMTVSWSAATGATSYKLYRGGSLISSSATSPYNDSGLSVATSYTYRVTAVNAGGETNCAADQSQTTTYWSKKMNGSTVKKINGTYVDKVNGI